MTLMHWESSSRWSDPKALRWHWSLNAWLLHDRMLQSVRARWDNPRSRMRSSSYAVRRESPFDNLSGRFTGEFGTNNPMIFRVEPAHLLHSKSSAWSLLQGRRLRELAVSCLWRAAEPWFKLDARPCALQSFRPSV